MRTSPRRPRSQSDAPVDAMVGAEASFGSSRSVAGPLPRRHGNRWRAVSGLLALGAAAHLGCRAGARYEVSADSARYPVSLSPMLLGPGDAPLCLGQELESLGQFTVEETKFGILYGFVPLGSVDVSSDVNREVRARGGDGVVSLAVTTRACATNYFVPLTLLPIWPGCQISTVTGIVVRALPPPSGVPAAR